MVNFGIEHPSEKTLHKANPVQTESLFQLINPLIFLCLAVGFGMVARLDRRFVSAGWLAAAYVCGAFGFCVDYLRPVLTPAIGVLGSQFFYAMTALTFAVGIRLRAGVSGMAGPLFMFGGGSFLLGVAIYWAGADLWTRTLLIHFANGAIFGVGAWGSGARKATRTDKLILALLWFNVAQFVIRPLLVYQVSGAPDTSAEYASSDMLLFFHLATGVCALMTAGLLLADYVGELVRSFRDIAQRDRLTGISNRRGFEFESIKLLKQIRRSGQSLCLIVADIDEFKRVNDVHGHGFGDDVIQAFAQLLAANAGPEAAVARFGGEEFVVAAPADDLEEGARLAELLRQRLDHQVFLNDAVPVKCSASFGVSMLELYEPIKTALLRADSALYLAKAAGRNLVRTQTDLGVQTLKAAHAQMSGGFEDANLTDPAPDSVEDR